uniref:N-acetylmuramoyl-l-alanine amidase family protein n=1 Tax=uncultured bacterium contig00038 TaxID=1181526 RepID=A0A806K1L4_9BACT|nr:N-acetylmuramoyl-l-alanine amidase family protein [uncultured bacterium contig00038]
MAAEPDLAEVKGRLPGGKTTAVRLQFKKGVFVDTKGLPTDFISKKGDLPKWLPFEELTAKGKRWALGALFPSDVWGSDEVKHVVRWPKLESVWLLSTLFTGHGQRYDRLMAANPKNPEQFREGDVWKIPKDLLSTELGGVAKTPDSSRVENGGLRDEDLTSRYQAMLRYERDSQGEYAVYKLRKGEALYSSVVMRYTDLVDANEVNQLAMRIAKRSGIENVRSIQPGQIIKIPLDCLADPFQPEGSKGRTEDRQLRAEVRRTAKIEAGPRLSGVRIVLDPGHGGIDSGARANGVWESDYVYDITMRVRRLLEVNTDAQIATTLRNEGIGFAVREEIHEMTTEAVLLTTPPVPNDGESSKGTTVHLRWLLANHFFTAKKNQDLRKTLFISFHADSLHPSTRGTMVYIPAANQVPNKPAWPGGIQVSEVKRGTGVNVSGKQKLESEARSLIFAEGLLKNLRKSGIPIHANRPIRNIIKRSGRSYVPAVIRNNVGMTKVLVEIVNLQNEEDAALIKDADFREKYAEAVVRAIREHFKK